MDGEGISRPSIHRRPEYSEFEIARRFEAEILSVNKRLGTEHLAKLAGEAHRGRAIDKLVASQLAQEEFDSHRTEPAQNARQFERRDPVDSKHVYGRSVVAEHHRTAVAGSPP